MNITNQFDHLSIRVLPDVSVSLRTHQKSYSLSFSRSLREYFPQLMKGESLLVEFGWGQCEEEEYLILSFIIQPTEDLSNGNRDLVVKLDGGKKELVVRIARLSKRFNQYYSQLNDGKKFDQFFLGFDQGTFTFSQENGNLVTDDLLDQGKIYLRVGHMVSSSKNQLEETQVERIIRKGGYGMKRDKFYLMVFNQMLEDVGLSDEIGHQDSIRDVRSLFDEDKYNLWRDFIRKRTCQVYSDLKGETVLFKDLIEENPVEDVSQVVLEEVEHGVELFKQCGF